MRRREYAVDIVVNGTRMNRIIIDPHYEEKHNNSITDEIILELVKTLDGEGHQPEKEEPPYLYFKKDRIRIDDAHYKLVWLLENNESYVGVINAYRR